MIINKWGLASCVTLLLLDGIQISSGQKFAHEPINPNVGGKVFGKKEDAKAWTKKHRTDLDGSQSEKKHGRSHYFSTTFLKTITDQKDCVGLNFYIARDNGEAKLIVVGISAAGKDLTGSYNIAKDGMLVRQEYVIGYSEMKCPNNCDDTSFLLTD